MQFRNMFSSLFSPVNSVYSPQKYEEKASKAKTLIALHTHGQPVWTPRNFTDLAREGFARNAVVYRCVRMVAEAAASVPLLAFEDGEARDTHPLLSLLAKPNATQCAPDLLEEWFGFARRKMTGDNFHGNLNWVLFAVLIIAVWIGVLNIRHARATLTDAPGVNPVQIEQVSSADLRPVWVIFLYEVKDEKPIGITLLVFESHEECQITSVELRKQLGLHLEPACHLKWMKEGKSSKGSKGSVM